ncbi:MAG: galactokinase [Nitrososphaerota archaeon]|nr:galactokinase [Nitrososphaerota archaeon]
MIITRSPFRISLGGGGTDLPSYYSRRGGFFVSGAVDKYVHIAVNPRFEQDSIRVSYSKTEIVDDASRLEHPLVREGLEAVGIRKGIEIVSVADAPAATGLGSSGSFCVGLLRALHAYLQEERSSQFIAEEAVNIAMTRLKEPSGKQDEYVASFGGIRTYEVDRDGEVKVQPLKLSTHSLAELEANIMMYYTGITRSSASVLSKQKTAIEGSSGLEKMDRIKEIGLKVRDALAAADLTRFGELLDEHWKVKRGVVSAMSNDRIDHWYDVAKGNGALGVKLCGAGGGGFLMVYCENGRSKLRDAMAKEGLVEHRFHFEPEGCKIIHNA